MGVVLNEKEQEANGFQPKPPSFSLRKCCCGCSLQTGAIVIGTFGLMNGIASVLLSLYGFGHVPSSRQMAMSDGEYEATMFDFYTGEENILSNTIMMIYGILHVVTAFSLICGADKRRLPLLKFWLFTRYVEFVMSILGSIFFVTTMIIQHAEPAPVFTTSLSFIICIGILAYCIGIVRSFYYEVLISQMQPIKQVI